MDLQNVTPPLPFNNGNNNNMNSIALDGVKEKLIVNDQDSNEIYRNNQKNSSKQLYISFKQHERKGKKD